MGKSFVSVFEKREYSRQTGSVRLIALVIGCSQVSGILIGIRSLAPPFFY